MKLTKIFILFLFISIGLGYITKSQAQYFDDLEARPSVSLEYKSHNDWSLTGTYYRYFDHNIKEYDKSRLGLEAKYDINSWLEVGLEYRYAFNKQKEHSNEIRYEVELSHDLTKDLKLEFRTMAQQEFVSLKKDYLKIHPIAYYWRNRLELSYDLTKDIEIYVFTENYVHPLHGTFYFDEQKSALGVKYDITKRNEIDVRFEVKNKRGGENVGRINIGYTFTFGDA